MIMQNNYRKQKIRETHTKRIFTMILQAAKPYFTSVDADYRHCTVRGVLNTKDLGMRAVISYDAVHKSLTVMVNLPVHNDWTMPKVMIFLRLQNHTAVGSSSINLDTESSTVRVKSHAALPVPGVAQAVVAAAIRDTVHVLQDDDFRRFVS